jgi:hypothetical protein
VARERRAGRATAARRRAEKSAMADAKGRKSVASRRRQLGLPRLRAFFRRPFAAGGRRCKRRFGRYSSGASVNQRLIGPRTSRSTVTRFFGEAAQGESL